MRTNYRGWLLLVLAAVIVYAASGCAGVSSGEANGAPVLHYTVDLDWVYDKATLQGEAEATYALSETKDIGDIMIIGKKATADPELADAMRDKDLEAVQSALGSDSETEWMSPTPKGAEVAVLVSNDVNSEQERAVVILADDYIYRTQLSTTQDPETEPIADIWDQVVASLYIT